MAKSDIRKENAKNIDYWAERLQDQLVNYGDMTHKQIRRKYYKEYKAMLLEVEHLMSDLYQKITINGTPSANELYKYNRYFEMHKELGVILGKYGKDWYKIVSPKFKELYIKNCSVIMSAYTVKHIDEKAIQKTARTLWNNKGKHWSEKVWCKGEPLNAIDRRKRSLQKLQTTLERGLLNCVGRGAPKDDLVKEIQDRFQVDWHESDRLVRTELTHLQNQSTLDGYQESGVEKYRYLAHEDYRTSEICHKLNGTIHKVEKAEVGVNYPPMHPNCRSTTVPVVNNYAPKPKTFEENINRKKANRDEYRKKVLEYNPKSKVKTYEELEVDYLIEQQIKEQLRKLK